MDPEIERKASDLLTQYERDPDPAGLEAEDVLMLCQLARRWMAIAAVSERSAQRTSWIVYALAAVMLLSDIMEKWL